MKTKLALLFLGLLVVAVVRAIGAETRMATPPPSTGIIPGEPLGILHRGWYGAGGLRGNFMEDARLERLENLSGGTVKFDPGFGFAGRGGYRFCEWFALEGEIGFTYNSIKSMTGASVDAWLSQVPFMANAVITIPTRSLFTPFGGVGAGGTTSILEADPIHYTSGVVTTDLWGSEATTTFSWQAFAGFEIAIDNRLSVHVMYNYRWVDGPKWDWAGFIPVEFGDQVNHSVTVGATYHF